MSAHTTNVAFVVDASGSMAAGDYKPTRLKAALQAAGVFIRRLARERPASKVALVCFSEHARILCGWTPVLELRDLKSTLTAWHKACVSCGMGGTAIGEGLREARLLAVGCPGPKRVVLLTDGHHNEGVAPSRVASSLRRIASLDIVGIGGAPEDVDEELLMRLASHDSAGEPRYRWIDDEHGLTLHFHELAGRLTRD